MITIKNLRTEKPDPKNIWQVRVDRASVLGNPFVLVTEIERQGVCDMYRDYFNNMLPNTNSEFYSELLRLERIYGHEGKLELFCWCAPDRCHCETIRDYILSQVDESKSDEFHSEE